MAGNFELWAEFHDANWVKLGYVPVPLSQASIKRSLDGLGKITLSTPIQERSLDMFQEERRVRIFVRQPSGSIRELGRGILDSVSNPKQAGASLTASGLDVLDEFRRTIVHKKYDNLSAETIFDDLVNEVGWSFELDSTISGQYFDARFDGASIFTCFREIMKNRGWHFRRVLGGDPTDRKVSIGVFGEDTGIQLLNTRLPISNFNNPSIGLIKSVKEVRTSATVANRIFLEGSGEGAAAVNLSKSDRTTPYLIQSKTFSYGSTKHFIQDDDSIAKYGVIEVTLRAKDITPITNTDPAQTRAANLLYDFGVTELIRRKEPQQHFSITVKDLETTVQPGDKLTLNYLGAITKANGEFDPKGEVSGTFWVTKVSEKASNSGISLSLDISNVDMLATTQESQLIDAVEAIKLRSRKPMIYPGPFTFFSFDFVQGSSTPSFVRDAEMTLKIDPLVITDLQKVLLTIETQPMFTPISTVWNAAFARVEGQARIQKSPNYPSDVTIWVNGAQVSGPHNPAPANAALLLTLDISPYIIDDPNGIYKSHKIVVKAGPRNGIFNYPLYASQNDNSNGLASSGLVLFSVAVLATGLSD